VKILIIFFLLPLRIFAQDITGLWTGFIHTTDKDLPYELAISENNGKLTGYSHTTFILNGVEEVGVKAVTVKNKNGNVLVEDEALVFNDFSEAPVKRIKQLDILKLIVEDTAIMLNGTFKTNIIRNYRSITGTIQLRKIDNSQKTKIIPKLDELNLANTLSFLQPKAKKEESVAPEVAVVEKVKPNISIKKEVATSSPVTIKEALPVLRSQSKDVAINVGSEKEKKPETVLQPERKEKEPTTLNTSIKETKENKPEATLQPKSKEKEMATLNTSVKENKPEIIMQPKPKEKEVATVSTSAKENKPEVTLQPKAKEKQAVVVNSSLKEKSKEVVQQTSKQTINVPAAAVKKPEQVSPSQEKEKQATTSSKLSTIKQEQQDDTLLQTRNAVASSVKPLVKSIQAQTPVVSAAELTKRKTEMIQSVFFKSDSLLLSLYDNGEVDGDIVSVVLNGKVIIASQTLSTNAITKTIYITPDLGDSLQLVMYAENLGSIPPNTGLLVLQDGKDRYEIRFAGDFQKNSAIILKRKRL